MSEEIKKRGRKKKIEENTGEIESIVEESSSEEIKEVKKRGRKPKIVKEEDLKDSEKIEELEIEKENKKEEIIKEEVRESEEKIEKDNKVSEKIDRHPDRTEKGYEKTEKNEKTFEENVPDEEKLIRKILNTNVTNLKKMAKEYNIPNFSVMTKYDLVNAVLIEKGKEIGKTYGYGKLDIMGEGSFGFLRNTSIGPDVYVSYSFWRIKSSDRNRKKSWNIKSVTCKR